MHVTCDHTAAVHVQAVLSWCRFSWAATQSDSESMKTVIVSQTILNVMNVQREAEVPQRMWCITERHRLSSSETIRPVCLHRFGQRPQGIERGFTGDKDRRVERLVSWTFHWRIRRIHLTAQNPEVSPLVKERCTSELCAAEWEQRCNYCVIHTR